MAVAQRAIVHGSPTPSIVQRVLPCAVRVINADYGTRYDREDISPTSNRIPSVCGRGGKSGYRYEQFARMFPSHHIAPICGYDQEAQRFGPLAFGEELAKVADAITKKSV